jgi:hypothetical protein
MKKSSVDLNLSLLRTRKQALFQQMEMAVPGADLVEIIAPYSSDGCTPFALQTNSLRHGKEVNMFGTRKLST